MATLHQLRIALVSLVCVQMMCDSFMVRADEAESLVRVPEVWVSTNFKCATSDSLAACPVGDQMRVYITAKGGHHLDILDGETGEYLHSIGAEGEGPRQFAYPNGIASIDVTGLKNRARHLLAVVERDNHRVQLIWADTERCGLLFGEDKLKKPYGIAAQRIGDGWRLFVTDADVDLSETVKVFDVRFDGKELHATYRTSFGETSGDGVVLEAESIVVDAVNGRLLLCDEDSRDRAVKVYSLNGKYTGLRFGGPQLHEEPEGIAIFELNGRRFVILTDQSKELTRWHLYDARSYEYCMSFTGTPKIANTDGIVILPPSTAKFPVGALVAVDDDCLVRAYSLADLDILDSKKTKKASQSSE